MRMSSKFVIGFRRLIWISRVVTQTIRAHTNIMRFLCTVMQKDSCKNKWILISCFVPLLSNGLAALYGLQSSVFILYICRVLHKFYFGQVKYIFNEKHLPKWHFSLPQKEKEIFFCIDSCMSTIHFKLAWFRQLLFRGLSKCLPKLDFYLPWASGQVLMSHPVSVLLSC